MDPQQMEALGRVAAEVDGESPQAQQAAAEEQQQQATADAEALAWAVIPTTAGKLLCMFAPELAPIYSADNCAEWGRDMAAVAQKNRWSGPSALPEVSLLISTAGFAVPSYMVIRMKLDAMKAEREKNRPVDGMVTEVKPSPAGPDAVASRGDNDGR